eukprot:GHVS01081230.1.p1 GENE.GHVS01081230.1~~GHVS01081230.1.p1  ORF type:complete len:133 (-),score=51.09 GHVS01081230.1:37-435(-)
MLLSKHRRRSRTPHRPSTTTTTTGDSGGGLPSSPVGRVGCIPWTVPSFLRKPSSSLSSTCRLPSSSVQTTSGTSSSNTSGMISTIASSSRVCTTNMEDGVVQNHEEVEDKEVKGRPRWIQVRVMIDKQTTCT